VALVTVYSIAKMEELLDAGVVDAAITEGHLILEKRDGTTIDAGSVITAIDNASTTTEGFVELATDSETITGTDANRAVTPLSLASLTSTDARRGLVELATTGEATTGTDTARAVTPAGLKTVADTLQPLDGDLTAIAGLSPSNDMIIQRKSGAWTSRTMAQLMADLEPLFEWVETKLHNGSAYVDADATSIYIGPTDPGSVNNGCVWYDTTGA
jgi:hypothetical protein